MSLLPEIKELLKEYEIHPQKKFSQSFCVEEALLKRMVTYVEPNKRDTILEIGSGFGFLTSYLSEIVKRVIAVEIDPKLLKALRDRVGTNRSVEIVPGNILKIQLPKFNKIVANPPYNISFQLTMRLFKIGFEKAVLTLQKEFAEKLIAKPGTKKYGPLTVFAKYVGSVKILENLPKGSFYPQPEVESVIILINVCRPLFEVGNQDFFFELVKKLFTQRNRNLKYPLETFLVNKMEINKLEIKKIIKQLPFINTRVCKMTPEEFGVVSNKIQLFLESKRIVFKNKVFYVFPEVYEPAEDTFLMAEILDVKKGETVLDVGTGCGILGILTAEKAQSVAAIDLNLFALKCTMFNADLNNVANKIDPVLGDLFAGYKGEKQFDLIIFNPPYLPTNQKTESGKLLEKAWNGGINGREVINRFLTLIPERVEKKGKVIILQSSLSNPDETIKMFRKMGFAAEVIAEKKIFFEKLTVIQAARLD